MNKPEWLFFDVGGVLIGDDATEKWRIDNVFDIAKKYRSDLTREMVVGALPEASSINDDLSRNFFVVLLKEPGQVKEAVTEIYKRYKEMDYFSNSPIKPDAQVALEGLRRRYKLGLIANQNIRVKENLKNLLPYLKFSGVSDDFGLIKPDPLYFKMVFDQTGAHPRNSVMIDDNIERGLIPAKNLGMTTVWFKNYEREVPSRVVDYTIRSLSELLLIF